MQRERSYYQLSNRQRIPQPTEDDIESSCNCADLNTETRSMKLSLQKLQVSTILFDSKEFNILIFLQEKIHQIEIGLNVLSERQIMYGATRIFF